MQSSDNFNGQFREFEYMFKPNPLKRLGVFQFACEEPRQCGYCRKKTNRCYQPYIYKRIITCEECFPKVIELGQENFD